MWLFYSVLTALFESIKDVVCKKSLVNLDEYLVAWSLRFFPLPFLLAVFCFVPMPAIGKAFWPALAVGGILNVLATVLYMKALKYGELSVSVPMITFTPVFLLITSPFILGEFPNIGGLLGIGLIVAGSYMINLRQKKFGLWEPFKLLLREKGPRTMLIVAFIWSITSNIDKIGVQHASVLIWVLAIHVFGSVFLLPVILYRRSQHPVLFFRRHLKNLIFLGGIVSLRSVFQMLAISMTLVVYVISVKRTSVIFAILFGYYVFKESGIRERMTGAIFMVAGVFFIAFS
jgi:uncharacterized membrane protein